MPLRERIQRIYAPPGFAWYVGAARRAATTTIQPNHPGLFNGRYAIDMDVSRVQLHGAQPPAEAHRRSAAKRSARVHASDG